jgi:hypothetical protein
VKLYCATTNPGKLGEFRIAADRQDRLTAEELKAVKKLTSELKALYEKRG